MIPAQRTGPVLLIVAMGAFAFSDALSKRLGPDIPPILVSWTRYLVLLATVLPLALARGQWRTRQPLLQAGRALGLVGSAVLFQYAIQSMPLTEATAMVFASPLFVTLLALLVLREPVRGWRWLPVLIGFAGVLVVTRPGAPLFGGAELFPIGSSIAWAVAVICTRRLAGDPIITTMLLPAVAGVVLLPPLLPPDILPRLLPHAPTVLLMAACWCAAQWLTLLAYRATQAAVLAPYAYTQLLWAGLLGFVLFDHLPDGIALAGMGLILASGVAAAWLSRHVR